MPDEDPYSNCNEVDSSGSSGFGASGIYGHIAREQQQIMLQSHYPPLRREKPPKLPPRDNHYGHHELHTGALKVSLKHLLNKFVPIFNYCSSLYSFFSLITMKSMTMKYALN